MKDCKKCNGSKWACENHPDQEAFECIYCKGAGMPCNCVKITMNANELADELEKQEVAYDDWVKLLHTANCKEEFLTNPRQIWLEAWTQATMIAWSILDENVPPEYHKKVHEQIKAKLLK